MIGGERMGLRISLEEAPDEAVQNAVLAGLTAYNESRVGPCPIDPVWAVARAEDGAVVGGVQGVVSLRWFFVNMLWVDEAARGAGVGSELLRRAEQAAVARGCANAFLYTFSFQAPDFYLRRGYRVFGDLEDFPGDNHQFWMRKALVAEP